MTRIFRAGAAFLVTLPLFFALSASGQTQSSPVTVTPTLVSVQLGQPLYCAARWTKPTVQLYCYTSSTGHTWDVLIYNSVFTISSSITVPYVLNCVPGSTTCPVSAGILWIFTADKVTPGVVDWDVAWNGTGEQKGTFQ